MATLGATYLDLIDLYKQQDANGQVSAQIIELLSQTNPILLDAIAVECNKGGEHLTTVRTGLPSVTWGALYKGVTQSKSQTQQVTDTTGFVDALATIDERVLKLSNNEAQTRLNEAMAFLEAMNQEMATGLFYHDTATTPEKFKGLAARYNSIGGGGAGNNIVDAGGSGSDNTSIWFVTWGERFTHTIFPRGMQAGLQREDMGRQRVLDSDSNPYYVKEEKFEWHIGLSVNDWRYNVRVANIDVSNMQAGSVALYDFMRSAYYKLQSRVARTDGARQAIYCNRDVLESLDELASNAGSSDNFVRLRPMEIEGEEVLAYRGIPLRQTDALLNTEAQIT